MFKGIVFDMDGTLVDSLSTTFDAFNYGIIQMGGRKHSPQEIIGYFGPGEGEILARIVGADKAAQAYALCRGYLDENMGKMPLHSGVQDLLEKLRAHLKAQ